VGASADSAAADIAVVIPARDEEDALPAVLAAIPRDRVGTVLVVDNGSADRTADVARTAGATVIHEPRRGYGAACLAGIAALRERPPEIVAFLDADGSDDPSELPRLVEPIDAGHAELVIGSRVLGTMERGALTPVQRFGNGLATRLLGICFGAHCTDLGPFRVIRWTVLERLGMRDRDFGWTVEMQARAARLGVKAIEVPVSSRRRRGGRSKISGTVRGAAAAGWKILWTIARVRIAG
jgi:glycosyltransferase involved in cell wall biosynthesis